jgi:Holin of 3TMs, for gene-transfer release
MSWITDAVGGALGDTVAKIGDTVKKFVTTDADRLALENELTKIRIEAEQKTMEIGVQYADIEAKRIESVNATMRAESASEHWPTYSWRPFIGFVFGAYIASMFILPLFGLSPVVMSPDLVLTVGAVLGVASYFRGKMQADPSVPTVNRG